MEKSAYQFGSFSVDPQARLLFRGGERVPLPPKAADLLIVLLEHHGDLVTKEELLQKIWPGTFVEEGSLSKHIFLLRRTLRESEDGTPYIETVPKRGYRFIGSRQSPFLGAVTFTSEERTSERGYRGVGDARSIAAQVPLESACGADRIGSGGRGCKRLDL